MNVLRQITNLKLNIIKNSISSSKKKTKKCNLAKWPEKWFKDPQHGGDFMSCLLEKLNRWLNCRKFDGYLWVSYTLVEDRHLRRYLRYGTATCDLLNRLEEVAVTGTCDIIGGLQATGTFGGTFAWVPVRATQETSYTTSVSYTGTYDDTWEF